jgi:hypothetical protein
MGIKEPVHSKKFRDELRYTLEKVEMERGQRSASATGTHSEPTERQMVKKVRVRGILASVTSTSGKQRMEFVYRDVNAAICTRRCVVLNTSSEEMTRSHFAVQLARLEAYNRKLKPVAFRRSAEARRRL